MFITLGSSRFLNILYGWKRVLFSYTTERVCYQVVKYRRGDLGSAELLSSSMDDPKPDTFLQPILQCCAERGEKEWKNSTIWTSIKRGVSAYLKTFKVCLNINLIDELSEY